MLVFEKEVTEWMHPGLYRVEQAGSHRLSADEVVSLVAETLPAGVKVKGVVVDSDPRSTYRVNLSKPKHAALFVDPYTGKVVGKYERLPFFHTMFRLHRWLLDSRPKDGEGIFWGKMIVGISTLMFVLALVSGVMVWWPRNKRILKDSLKLPLRKGRFRFWRGIHVAGGMYVLVLLLVMALTGLTWSFGWFREWFYEFFGTDKRTVYAIHVGSFGGLPTRILWFLGALMGALLPLTGYYLWVRRLLRRRRGNRPEHLDRNHRE